MAKPRGNTQMFPFCAMHGWLKIVRNQEILTAFDQVIIPHSTLGWLADEKRELSFHQPSRIADARELRQLLANQTLLRFEGIQSPDATLVAEVGEDLASLLAEASVAVPEDSRKRLVVRPAPVHRLHSLMEEEADLGAFRSDLCCCLDVVEKLAQKAQLTATEERNARAYLSLHERSWPGEHPIPDEAVLYLDDVAVSYLQHLRLLHKLPAAGLTAIVADHQIAEGDALLEYETLSGEAVELLDNLRRRLREGINAGKIQLGKRQRMEKLVSGQEHPTLHAFDLVGRADALVVDDRSLNTIANVPHNSSSTPLITSLDVLDILVERGGITPNQREDALTNLRGCGISFVPIGEEQLRRLILSCSVVDGKVRESAELKAIRENVLRLAMTDALQIPHEMGWLSSLFQVALRVLKDCWLENVDDARARARSDWLLNLLDLRRWSHRFAPPADLNVIYADQIMLLLKLFALEAPAVKRRYHAWLEDNFLQQLAYEEPKLYYYVLARISNLIEAAIGGLGEGGEGV